MVLCFSVDLFKRKKKELQNCTPRVKLMLVPHAIPLNDTLRVLVFPTTISSVRLEVLASPRIYYTCLTFFKAYSYKIITEYLPDSFFSFIFLMQKNSMKGLAVYPPTGSTVYIIFLFVILSAAKTTMYRSKIDCSNPGSTASRKRGNII